MRSIRAVLVLAAVVVAAACAATKEGDVEDIKFSGFLSTYDGLVRTNDDEMAAFRYVKPGLSLVGYRQILLDKPEARMSPEALKDVGDDDMGYLLAQFDKSMRDAMSQRWIMATEPGEGVLRVRTCMTDASGATAVLTPFSRILPWGRLISGGTQLATGTALNVGKVGGEMEITDSMTGERLIACVDRRQGQGVLVKAFTSWGDVTAAFDKWAEMTCERLPQFGMPNKSSR
jgi:hypothetical protein